MALPVTKTTVSKSPKRNKNIAFTTISLDYITFVYIAWMHCTVCDVVWDATFLTDCNICIILHAYICIYYLYNKTQGTCVLHRITTHPVQMTMHLHLYWYLAQNMMSQIFYSSQYTHKTLLSKQQTNQKSKHNIRVNWTLSFRTVAVDIRKSAIN